MPQVVGFDLGTTNSVIATIIGGEPTEAEGTLAVDVQAGELRLRKGEPAPV